MHIKEVTKYLDSQDFVYIYKRNDAWPGYTLSIRLNSPNSDKVIGVNYLFDEDEMFMHVNSRNIDEFAHNLNMLFERYIK